MHLHGPELLPTRTNLPPRLASVSREDLHRVAISNLVVASHALAVEARRWPPDSGTFAGERQVFVDLTRNVDHGHARWEGQRFVVAVALHFAVTWLFCALLGLTDALQATPRNAVIQLITPDHLRGRVSSFRHMLVTGMPSLGQGAMGGAAMLLTPPVGLILGATICAFINIGLLTSRRDLRARDLGAEALSEAQLPVESSGWTRSERKEAPFPAGREIR